MEVNKKKLSKQEIQKQRKLKKVNKNNKDFEVVEILKDPKEIAERIKVSSDEELHDNAERIAENIVKTTKKYTIASVVGLISAGLAGGGISLSLFSSNPLTKVISLGVGLVGLAGQIASHKFRKNHGEKLSYLGALEITIMKELMNRLEQEKEREGEEIFPDVLKQEKKAYESSTINIIEEPEIV